MQFSIIIPVYNSVAHLSACVTSVLRQAHTDWELLLVDDGSVDGSVEMGRDFAGRDSRIRFFPRSHQGVSAARNHGLREASGRFVNFMDSDDTLRATALQDADNALSRIECDLVIFSMVHLHHRKEGIVETARALKDRSFANGSTLLAHWLENRNLLLYANTNKFYRRSVVDRAGILFEPGVDFGEDRLFNYAFLRRCGVIVSRSEITYEYHLRLENSLSSRFRAGVVADAIKLHEAKRRLFEDLGFDFARIHNFLVEDLSTEIHLAVNHFRSHWRRLGRSGQRRAARALVEARHPEYLRDVRPPTLRARLFFLALRHRRPEIVRWLIHAGART